MTAPVSLNNLAAIAQARGNSAKAEDLYRRALDLKKKLLGIHHPDTGMTSHNLAVLYRDHGCPTQARLLARRVLAIFENSHTFQPPSLGPRDRGTAAAFTHLATAITGLARTRSPSIDG